MIDYDGVTLMSRRLCTEIVCITFNNKIYDIAPKTSRASVTTTKFAKLTEIFIIVYTSLFIVIVPVS